MDSREPGNILLVDDQPAKLLSYDTILSELGENLLKANSGREALECLLKTEVAVVLVDVCMPDLDGYELSTMIRNHPRFQRTAIILVSGVLTEDVDRLKGYVSGAVDYVSVPIVPEILRAKVSVFTELFRKSRAVERLNQELEHRVERRTAALSETAQKLQQAYESSHFLASIVESSDDAIIGQTLSGIIRTWNSGAERLFGFKAEEILGHNISELMPGDRLAEEDAVFDRVRSGQRAEHFETVRVRKDGTLVEVSWKISVIRDEAGELIGASAIARDITQERRNAQLMMDTQKLESLGVLSGGIAHDFNNLLVGILGNSSLALDLLPDGAEAKPLIEAVADAGERAAALTRQLLAYSGRATFVLSDIHLSRHVRETVTLIQAAVPRTVEVQFNLEANLPIIKGDASQIQQLVMNLAINGAEAIPDGTRGTLTITTCRQQVTEEFIRKAERPVTGDLVPGSYIMLEVRDSGSGMEEATKARIFEPFFTTKFTGRGLGLAAVLGIVKGHHGFMQVFSRPEHGSTFRVLFPAANEAEGLSLQEKPDGRAYRGQGTVLVIDDEQIVRNLAKAALEQFGYSVILAENGLEGLELFRRNPDRVQCVVLDATMPVMSGEETLLMLRGLQTDVPVILSSGLGEAEIRRRFEGKGVAAFVQKPYRSMTLLDKVTAVVSRKPSIPTA